MSNSYKTDTIPPEFLSNFDVDYICELIREWHSENDRDIESFSFNIEVSWENNNEN